jgi:hypothetical protein
MALNRIEILNGELTADPLGRGYAGMSDQEAADSLNVEDRSETLTSVRASAVLEATIISEYNALTDGQKGFYHSMLAMGELDPYGANTRAVFADLFGAGTTTRANLLALSTRAVSRGEELGIGIVTVEGVTRARAFVP